MSETLDKEFEAWFAGMFGSDVDSNTMYELEDLRQAFGEGGKTARDGSPEQPPAAALNMLAEVRRYARRLRDYAATIDDHDEGSALEGIANDVLKLVTPE